jgi:hypothetical protein
MEWYLVKHREDFTLTFIFTLIKRTFLCRFVVKQQTNVMRNLTLFATVQIGSRAHLAF